MMLLAVLFMQAITHSEFQSELLSLFLWFFLGAYWFPLCFFSVWFMALRLCTLGILFP